MVEPANKTLSGVNDSMLVRTAAIRVQKQPIIDFPTVLKETFHSFHCYKSINLHYKPRALSFFSNMLNNMLSCDFMFLRVIIYGLIVGQANHAQTPKWALIMFGISAGNALLV